MHCIIPSKYSRKGRDKLTAAGANYFGTKPLRHMLRADLANQQYLPGILQFGKDQVHPNTQNDEDVCRQEVGQSTVCNIGCCRQIHHGCYSTHSSSHGLTYMARRGEGEKEKSINCVINPRLCWISQSQTLWLGRYSEVKLALKQKEAGTRMKLRFKFQRISAVLHSRIAKLDISWSAHGTPAFCHFLLPCFCYLMLIIMFLPIPFAHEESCQGVSFLLSTKPQLKNYIIRATQQ